MCLSTINKIDDISNSNFPIAYIGMERLLLEFDHLRHSLVHWGALVEYALLPEGWIHCVSQSGVRQTIAPRLVELLGLIKKQVNKVS